MPELARRRKRLSKTRQLLARAEELRIEFAEADLAIAMTFVRLARSHLQASERERAARLLRDAQHAADTVGKILRKLPDEIANGMSGKLSALVNAIDETRKVMQNSCI